MNVTLLRGTLSSDPVLRELKSGDRLLTLELTTASEAGPAESAPVAWFDPPSWALDLEAGDDVVVTGRVRRRFFRGRDGRTGSATSVVADRVVRARQHRRRAQIVERALAPVLALLEHSDH